MAAPAHRCGFLAPHILKAIASSDNATPEAKKHAVETLEANKTFAEARKVRCAHHTETGHHHAPQGFVPPHVLDAISHSDSTSPQAREGAQQAMLPSQAIRDARAAASDAVQAKPAAATLVRKIYDSKNGEDLQKTLSRGEGAKRVKDRSTNNAYDGLGIVHDFYYKVFARNSIDDKGMALIGNVHYMPKGTTEGYDNAFWDGDQMVFGDGDGETFDDFTDGLDVLAHELTHGVTQYTAKLEYQDQAGALNESMSDVFACMIEQWWFGQTAVDGDWLLGQGLLSMLRRGPALRSLKAPGTAYKNDPILGTDPQPAHMNAYNKTTEDNGGVHLNSGIPNKAFYLAATGLGGFSWDKAGQIWYKTLTDPTIKPTCNFKEFAELTVTHATALYGPGAATTVRSAWVGVGVLP